MGEGRRGFLGKLLGGLAGAGAAATLRPAEAAKLAEIVPVAPAPIPAKKVRDGGRTVLLRSPWDNHRIQIEPDRAIQFRSGTAWVTPEDAERIVQLQEEWAAKATPGTTSATAELMVGNRRARR